MSVLADDADTVGDNFVLPACGVFRMQVFYFSMDFIQKICDLFIFLFQSVLNNFYPIVLLFVINFVVGGLMSLLGSLVGSRYNKKGRSDE